MIRPAPRRPFQQRGQTLIIALLVLGVLLILSAVFAGILSRAIRGAGFAANRATVSDFSEAGIRYAHGQLLNSDLGADWFGTPTVLTDFGGGLTRDPDAYYLRPPAVDATGVAFANPDTGKSDMGGPDGLGPYFRVNFEGGRALVRVRYAPGDPTIFSASASTTGPASAGRVGNFLQPGLARNYLIIESVGHLGTFIPNDPTSGSRSSVQFRNFGSAAAFGQALATLRAYDAREATSRKLLALAQIGLIDTARFFTDKNRVSRPAEIGGPESIGARDANGPIKITTQIGGQTKLLNLAPGGGNVPSLTPYAGLGSLFSNADLRIHGDVTASLIPALGDVWSVAGTISAGDSQTQLKLLRTTWNGTGWTTGATNLNASQLNSDTPGFSTQSGSLRDGGNGLDANGFPRGVGRKEPPTILGANGSASRYVLATKETGALGNQGRTGQYGHGEGIYVDNRTDFQTSADEESRQIAGTSQSLVQDWLNPFGDGVTFRSGWRGPYYIPVGATVRLMADGFMVARGANPDAPTEEHTWRDANGADSGLTTIRYRVGSGTDGLPHVMDSLTAPTYGATINGAITTAQYQKAPVFNGVLYFEGNVRVRGVIPTDVQMTMVTNRTAYIEGSILKGTVGNDVTRGYPTNAFAAGVRLSRRSRSELMIMARDYVAVNPTMFFGPTNQTNAQAERGGNGVGGYNPVRLSAPDGEVTLQSEMPLNEANDDPSTWRPLALDYQSYVTSGTGTYLPTKMLVTHTLEATAGGPTATFITLGVNEADYANPTYGFEVAESRTNGARAQYAAINAPAPPPAYAGVYGLGLEPFEQSSRFETIGFPLLDRTHVTYTAASGTLTSTEDATVQRGTYTLTALDSNAVRLRLTALGTDPVGSYLLGRSALVPNDIRIEASVYAQEGSFFVIPGDWYNPNPNDTREAWVASTGAGTVSPTAAQIAAANEQRLTEFGALPDAPFYGEPLDVRIEIVGSVSENMPPPIATQGEWLKKWGWIPLQSGTNVDASGNPLYIPTTHIPAGYTPSSYAPNLIVRYDPTLATGRVAGFAADNLNSNADRYGNNAPVRYRIVKYDPALPAGQGLVNVSLPPMPRLPVSPTLAYFGEAK